MVTTRSADKRLDTAREDLVLRSRTVGSPSSVASTPSQSQKRTANSRENIDSLRSKRVRTEPAGTNPSKSTHAVVNIPVKAIHHENDSVANELVRQIDSKASTELKSDNDSITDNRVQSTPNAKASTITETPEQGSESFKTPATSRHRRFDSEELDDDTIIVSTTIDSSAPQGYQTADEEIADSDDEAPVIESTKFESRLPRGRSSRTPRGKKQPTSILDSIDMVEEIVEAAPSQTETESPTIGKESSASDHDLDQLANATKLGQGISEDRSLISSIPKLSHSQITISSTPPQRNTFPILPQILSPPRNQEIVSAGDADGESVTVSDSTLQDLSLTARNDSTRNNFFPYVPRKPTEIPGRDLDLVPMATAARLPAKTTSSLSDYRRRKCQQKVAGSAGGFKLQAEWSKKRSSFVVS